MIVDPNAASIAAMFERHHEKTTEVGQRICRGCAQQWPCDAAILGYAWQRVTNEAAAYWEMIANTESRLVAAERRVRDLEAGLAEYGRHKLDCPQRQPRGRADCPVCASRTACTCGLAALAGKDEQQ